MEPITEAEACARSARLSCIELAVTHYGPHHLSDPSEIVKLAKRMWDFVEKGE